MPRPKGSKNKPKTIKTTVDFAAQLAEKQSAKEVLSAEIASIAANIDTLKVDLKEKKVMFDKPVKARYIRFTALSEQRGQDYASGAELTILAE